MKKLLRNILLISSILLVVNIVLDFVFTNILRHSQSNPYKEWNCIMQDSIDADLLIMGSSRAWVQYDPFIMDSMLGINTYNLGINASHVKRQIIKYKVYRHYQRKKPSFLVFNFDYWGSWQRSDYQLEQFFPYVTNVFMRRCIIDNKLIRKRFLYIPMYRYYYHGIYELLEKASKTTYEYKGYKANTSKWDGEELAEIESVQFEPLQDVVDSFDAFLKELQEDGVKVIFVSSPIYVEASEKTVNLFEFYDFRQRFSDKYNVPVLDYINDPICNDTTYFFNATHLNKTGAELFTIKLCRDLDSLGILQN